MIEFGGIRIELQRNGTALTGRAHFPEAFHRDPLPIDITVKADGAEQLELLPAESAD